MKTKVISKESQIKALKKSLKETTLQKNIAERYNDHGVHSVVLVAQLDRIEKKEALLKRLLPYQGKTDATSLKLVQQLLEKISVLNLEIADHRDWEKQAREYASDWLKQRNKFDE